MIAGESSKAYEEIVTISMVGASCLLLVPLQAQLAVWIMLLVLCR